MSNRRDTVSFEIEIADLPMLAHAIMLQATTAQMGHHYAASERMRKLVATVKAQIPKVADLFSEYVFCEMCAALALDPAWTTTIKSHPYAWGDKGYIVVEIGGRKFRSDDSGHTSTDDSITALMDFLEEMAPTQEEVATWAPSDYCHPISAERAKSLLHQQSIRFGMDITKFMTADEEREIRQAWLDQNNGKMSLRDYVIKISKSDEPTASPAP